MTASLGYHNPDELPITLATILTKIVEDEPFENTLGILHHQEGIDLIPANIELSGMEVSLVNIMSRELVLKQYIERMREEYNYILIDCMPSLGMLTINALASVDAVLIPVQAAYLPVKGLEQLIRTIGKVRRQLNKQLKIGGILITMVDNRTNYARDISDLIFDTYGNQIKIFPQSIPFSVRAAEISAEGHINPATVLKGMNILVSKGWIEKRRGLGMFVVKGAVESIRKERRESFYDTFITPMKKEAEKLNLSNEDIVSMIMEGKNEA